VAEGGKSLPGGVRPAWRRRLLAFMGCGVERDARESPRHAPHDARTTKRRQKD
jgi:hypothetical protein